jgi:hypothetical protein
MLRITRLASFAAAATAVAGLGSASSAVAATADVDDYICQFSGLTRWVSPAVDAIVPKTIPNLDTAPDTGTFSFSTRDTPAPALPSVCVEVSADINDADDADRGSDPNAGGSAVSAEGDAGLVSIDASGDYANFVCGSGVASGTATTLGTTVAAADESGNAQTPVVTTGSVPPENATATFSITFVGGSGVLDITSFRSTDGDTGMGAGYVNIVPDPFNRLAGNCVTQSVTAFRVNGAFAATVASQSS